MQIHKLSAQASRQRASQLWLAGEPGHAYTTVYGYLKDNYDDTAKLTKYWGYLANNVVFIQISTDVSSALKIFETINERGVGLNPMDLLKNLLFTQVNQISSRSSRTNGRRSPSRWRRQGEAASLPALLPDGELRHQDSRGDAVVREDEIYDWFVDRDNAALCDYQSKPFEFVRKIVRGVDHYLAFGRGWETTGTRPGDGEP